MTAGPPSQQTVKSAMRTLDLIEYVVAHPGGVVAQEISAALSIPVSSLSYLLATLVERTYLHRNGRRYVAGAGLDRLRRPREERSLAEHAQPLMRALRLTLNETASLFVLKEWEMEAVVTETAEQSLRYSIETGTRTPLHCVAAGKALLAALSADHLEGYFEQSHRERFTPFTLCDRQELLDEIAVVRETGIGRTHDEFTIGISGVGAAIRMNGVAVAALGVAVPTPRFGTEAEARVIDQVLKTAHAIEGSLAAAG